MNNTFKKIIKGTIAIFAIKLIVITGVFTFQSCDTNDDNSVLVEVAKDNFLNSLKISQEKIKSVPVINSKSLIGPKGDNYISSARDMQGATETLCLMSLEEFTDDIVDDINNLSDLIETKTNHNLLVAFNGTSDTSTNSNYNPDDCLGVFTLPQQPVSDALDPVVQNSINYLHAIGFTDQEINLMLSENNGQLEDLIPTIMLVEAYVDGSSENSTTFVNHFFYTMNAQEQTGFWQQAGNCAMTALGIDLVTSLASMQGSKNDAWKKKAVKKLIGKVASRMMGPIGVAIAIVSFGICMGGW